MLKGGPTMVAEQTGGEFVGLVRAYGLEPRDKRCFLDLRLPAESNHLATEASLAFLDYLFTYIGLRKIYIETIDCRREFLQQVSALGFDEEVSLSEYVWHGKEYHALVFLSLTSTAWEARRIGVINTLHVGGLLSPHPVSSTPTEVLQ